jgi:hypothetical protein
MSRPDRDRAHQSIVAEVERLGPDDSFVGHLRGDWSHVGSRRVVQRFGKPPRMEYLG